jgi:hypothetical protein
MRLKSVTEPARNPLQNDDFVITAFRPRHLACLSFEMNEMSLGNAIRFAFRCAAESVSSLGIFSILCGRTTTLLRRHTCFVARKKRETSMNSRTLSLGLCGGVFTLSLLTPSLATAQNSAPDQTLLQQPAPQPQTHSTQQKPPPSQPELPNAPSPAPQPPSLSDLGITEQQAQGNPKLQAELNKRTEMLKIHQRLGLITLAPMAATLITGPMAKAKGRNGQPITEPTNANLDFHAALGSATAAMYFTTAYFAIAVPKIPNNPKHGAIRFHEALAFVHGPGMIMTPILGAMAFQQEQNGEKVHGIASYHGPVAIATVCAYGASIVAVSWPIHIKFWEKQ